MTNVAPQYLETKNVSGRVLRVTFVWNRDRFAHLVAAIDGTRLIPLLASLDGCDVAADWPTSPPLQQLSIETFGDAPPVALLVGMAGRSHWSASVQAVKNEAAFLFDIALRTGSPPTFAGSGYRSMTKAAIRDTRLAEIDVDDVRCEIASVGENPLRLEDQSDGFSLRCLDAPVRFPATLRWQYKVRLV